jgi:hypothetical protein
MALPLALPLAPVISSGATAAAATFIAGSSVYLADTLYGFRRSAPTLPPLTGLEGTATLAEKVADYLAGARVPVGFPLPPPWDPRATALGLAASALGLWGSLQNASAQLWGWAAGKNRTGVPGADWTLDTVGATYVGTYSKTQSTTVTVTGGWLIYYISDPASQLILDNRTSTNTFATGIEDLSINVYRSDQATYPGNNQAFMSVLPSGSSTRAGIRSAGYPLNNVYRIIGFSGVVTFSTNDQNALSVVNLPDDSVLPNRGDLATLFVPASVPKPLELPGIKPASPTVPNAEPVTQPLGDPAQRVRPATVQVPTLPRPTVYLPKTPTTAQPTQTATGQLQQPAPAPVPTTAVDAIYPIPGAPPITANGPRATPVEMAKELGRIEQKLELMLRAGGQGGGLPDWLQIVGDLAKAIYNALVDGAPDGSYSLSSPCELDEDGKRIIREVQIPAASDNWSRLQVRIDALAELLQVHKDLKQPNCKPKPPQGEFVTVNFEQID